MDNVVGARQQRCHGVEKRDVRKQDTDVDFGSSAASREGGVKKPPLSRPETTPFGRIESRNFGGGVDHAKLKQVNLFWYPTQRLEIPASGHYFSQHRADFSVNDDIRPVVNVGRLAVNYGERSSVRLCDQR
jgi:hypothetical protein